MARVALLTGDLLFGSRLKGALEAAGHAVELLGNVGEARALATPADVLLVDLASGTVTDATELPAALPSSTRTLAFYAHVDADVRAAAEQAGFELVVPRSRIAREAGALVERLLSSAA
jgi:hypothetical protein